MCKISIYLVILTSLLSIVECNGSDVIRNVTKARASDENDNLLSRVVGVPGAEWDPGFPVLKSCLAEKQTSTEDK